VRQTMYELEVAELKSRPTPDAERIADYEATIARYDNEPDPNAPTDSLKGEGKKQLAAQARSYEAIRERASEQDGNFDYSEVFLQLAIVLASVAILASSRWVLTLGVVLGAIGTLLMINGYLLLFPLPI